MIFRVDPQASNKRKLDWSVIYLKKVEKNIAEVSEDTGIPASYIKSLTKEALRQVILLRESL